MPRGRTRRVPPWERTPAASSGTPWVEGRPADAAGRASPEPPARVGPEFDEGTRVGATGEDPAAELAVREEAFLRRTSIPNQHGLFSRLVAPGLASRDDAPALDPGTLTGPADGEPGAAERSFEQRTAITRPRGVFRRLVSPSGPEPGPEEPTPEQVFAERTRIPDGRIRRLLTVPPGPVLRPGERAPFRVRYQNPLIPFGIQPHHAPQARTGPELFKVLVYDQRHYESGGHDVTLFLNRIRTQLINERFRVSTISRWRGGVLGFNAYCETREEADRVKKVVAGERLMRFDTRTEALGGPHTGRQAPQIT